MRKKKAFIMACRSERRGFCSDFPVFGFSSRTESDYWIWFGLIYTNLLKTALIQ
jgi:hypothetical protein